MTTQLPTAKPINASDGFDGFDGFDTFDKARPMDDFARRVANIYQGQRRRAEKLGLPFSLERAQLAIMVRRALESVCPYCCRALTVKNFTLDHDRPIARGGSFELANLTVCCDPCNRAKGILTGGEFTQLSDLIHKWHPRAEKHLLAQLRAGAARRVGR